MHLCPGEEFPQAFPVPVAAQGAEAGVAGRHFAIAGLCDAHQSVVTEYFAEGTVPTEYCDVHYQGNVFVSG